MNGLFQKLLQEELFITNDFLSLQLGIFNNTTFREGKKLREHAGVSLPQSMLNMCILGGFVWPVLFDLNHCSSAG